MNMLIPLRTDKVIGRLLKVSMAAVDRKQPSLALTVFVAGIGPPDGAARRRRPDKRCSNLAEYYRRRQVQPLVRPYSLCDAPLPRLDLRQRLGQSVLRDFGVVSRLRPQPVSVGQAEEPA